jgi:hypothetical protein
MTGAKEILTPPIAVAKEVGKEVAGMTYDWITGKFVPAAVGYGRLLSLPAAGAAIPGAVAKEVGKEVAGMTYDWITGKFVPAAIGYGQLLSLPVIGAAKVFAPYEAVRRMPGEFLKRKYEEIAPIPGAVAKEVGKEVAGMTYDWITGKFVPAAVGYGRLLSLPVVGAAKVLKEKPTPYFVPTPEYIEARLVEIYGPKVVKAMTQADKAAKIAALTAMPGGTLFMMPQGALPAIADISQQLIPRGIVAGIVSSTKRKEIGKASEIAPGTMALQPLFGTPKYTISKGLIDLGLGLGAALPSSNLSVVTPEERARQDAIEKIRELVTLKPELTSRELSLQLVSDERIKKSLRESGVSLAGLEIIKGGKIVESPDEYVQRLKSIYAISDIGQYAALSLAGAPGAAVATALFRGPTVARLLEIPAWGTKEFVEYAKKHPIEVAVSLATVGIDIYKGIKASQAQKAVEGWQKMSPSQKQEQIVDNLNKAHEQGLITHDQYMRARERLSGALFQERKEIVSGVGKDWSKAYAQGRITAEEYNKYLLTQQETKALSSQSFFKKMPRSYAGVAKKTYTKETTETIQNILLQNKVATTKSEAIKMTKHFMKHAQAYASVYPKQMLYGVSESGKLTILKKLKPLYPIGPLKGEIIIDSVIFTGKKQGGIMVKYAIGAGGKKIAQELILVKPEGIATKFLMYRPWTATRAAELKGVQVVTADIEKVRELIKKVGPDVWNRFSVLPVSYYELPLSEAYKITPLDLIKKIGTPMKSGTISDVLAYPTKQLTFAEKWYQIGPKQVTTFEATLTRPSFRMGQEIPTEFISAKKITQLAKIKFPAVFGGPARDITFAALGEGKLAVKASPVKFLEAPKNILETKSILSLSSILTPVVQGKVISPSLVPLLEGRVIGGLDQALILGEKIRQRLQPQLQLKPVSFQKLIPVTTTIPKIAPIVAPAEEIATTQLGKLINIQVPIQIPRAELIPIQVPVISPQLETRVTTKPVISPQLIPPELLMYKFMLVRQKELFKKRRLKKKLAPTAYIVTTKKRRKEVQISPVPLVRGEALYLGQKVAKATERASFRLKPVAMAPRTLGLPKITEAQLVGFRPPKRGGVDVWIQPRRLRMAVPSEYKAIQKYIRSPRIKRLGKSRKGKTSSITLKSAASGSKAAFFGRGAGKARSSLFSIGTKRRPK